MNIKATTQLFVCFPRQTKPNFRRFVRLGLLILLLGGWEHGDNNVKDGASNVSKEILTLPEVPCSIKSKKDKGGNHVLSEERCHNDGNNAVQ
mmetsp:Transcript_4301/g.9243  ORF Transcript_4301/g.9243 Transcript_4301/m.9243 type:complete len:92 (+) Transcript_4301:1226-1501(+)